MNQHAKLHRAHVPPPVPRKKAIVIGGGTINKVSPHLAVCAPAYGTAARIIADLLQAYQCHTSPNGPETLYDIQLVLTKMAGGEIETNQDLAQKISEIVADYSTKLVFFTAAVCDFEPVEVFSNRLESRQYSESNPLSLALKPSEKILASIRKNRKDIFLVGFKTTHGSTPEEMFAKGMTLLKKTSSNLVLVNDTKERMNMILTPEESSYCHTSDRRKVLSELVEMAYLRSHLTFTRSTVVSGDAIPWNSELVPKSLRAVVNYCIKRGAYKEFMGATVGHFACKLDDTTFLTSIRKSNFNNIEKNGLVKIKTDGPDTVIAYGMKPSVGGQSQRIIFSENTEYDCIVHFHCKIKHGSHVPIVSQKEYECGSHECGKNTASGLKKFMVNGHSLSAVYLNNHGPNIVFNKDIDPMAVIEFIEANFDLDTKTTNLESAIA